MYETTGSYHIFMLCSLNNLHRQKHLVRINISPVWWNRTFQNISNKYWTKCCFFLLLPLLNTMYLICVFCLWKVFICALLQKQEFISWRHNIIISCFKWDTHPYFYLEGRFHAYLTIIWQIKVMAQNINNIILFFTNKVLSNYYSTLCL